MAELVAVVDIGKTNTRFHFIDEGLQTRHRAVLESRVVETDLYPCYPVDDIFAWIIAELKSISQRHVVKSIVVITHGAAIALTDGNELILPIMDYEFTGPEEYSSEYDLIAADFASTRSPQLPAGLNLGRQLYWQQKKFPQQFSKGSCWLMYPQYWAWRLSGIASTEVTSLGCHTDLWQAVENNFSGFALRQGWDKNFPPIQKAWDELGKIKSEIVQQTGISPDCVVSCGVHDSNASFMLQRSVLHQDFVLLSTGTWLVGMGSSKNNKDLSEHHDTLYLTSAWGKPIPSFRFAAGKEYAEISGLEKLEKEPTLEDVQTLVAAGVYAYPAFSTLGGPFAGTPGKFSEDVIEATTRNALAAMYCALMTDYCLELIAVDGDLVIEGPFASNLLYCQVLASLMPARNILIAPYENSIVSAGVFLCTHELVDWGETEYRCIRAKKIHGLREYKQDWRTTCGGLESRGFSTEAK
ncbi:MAG: L-fuculose kinase [Proteobacteria bacterium]|nr:L-fuculose kinase [Pseudomonadota bacterium]